MNPRWSALFLLALLTATLLGCASTDPANESARPWATPKQWETGLPSQMFEGR